MFVTRRDKRKVSSLPDFVNWNFYKVKEKPSPNPLYLRLREVLNATTDRQLAELLKVTPQSVNGWKRTGKVKRDKIKSVADLTGVSFAWLLTGEGEKYSANSVKKLAQSKDSEDTSRAVNQFTLSAKASTTHTLSALPVVASILANDQQLIFRDSQEKVMVSSLLAESDSALITIEGDGLVSEGLRDGDLLAVVPANGDCNGKLVVALVNNKAIVRHFEQVDTMAHFSALYGQLPLIRVPLQNVEIKFVVTSITQAYKP